MQKVIAAALLGSMALVMTGAAGAQPPAEAIVPVSTGSSLSVDTGMKTLLADPKAKDVIAKYAPGVVEFFVSGQAEGLVSSETPLATLAQNQMAINAGLSPENMKKIAAELGGR